MKKTTKMLAILLAAMTALDAEEVVQRPHRQKGKRKQRLQRKKREQKQRRKVLKMK